MNMKHNDDSQYTNDGQEILENLRHAIGHTGWRNYYCAEIGGRDWQLWSMAVGIGLARTGMTINDGRDMIFCVTHAGLEFLKNEPNSKIIC